MVTRSPRLTFKHSLPAHVPGPVRDFRLLGRVGHKPRLPAGLGGKPPPSRALDVAAHEVAEDLSHGLVLCFRGSHKLGLQGRINPQVDGISLPSLIRLHRKLRNISVYHENVDAKRHYEGLESS